MPNAKRVSSGSHVTLPSGSTMHPRAQIYCVFLLSTLVSCAVFIDGQDQNSAVHWDGPWVPFSGFDYPAVAWKDTLTLGNQSGITVTLTFTGESEPLA